MIRTPAILLGLLCILPAASRSQFLDVKSLKALDSLSVWIESAKVDSAGIAITEAGLKADIEKRLRTAGFKVLDDSPQHLYLSVNVLKSNYSEAFACNIKLELFQGAWLERTDEWNYCSTWFREYLGLYDRESIPAEITLTVSDLLTLFLTDALSVNPQLHTK